jgi:tRNA/rRNA methyltransferase
VPIGPHIVDIVSFPLRTVIELVPPDESGEVETARAERRAWLAAREYVVHPVTTATVDADVIAVLDHLAQTMGLDAPAR